jgi:hypothetical protein
MADCLWSIRDHGRDADRKEALTAYREYVLHAPAGADARTISRMRHLEDVLATRNNPGRPASGAAD